jgi:hypothetical protein
MISIDLQQQLNELAQDFGRRLLSDLQKAFTRYKRSGALVDSLELSIINASESEAPKIVVTYADQGFFIGQKSPQWTKLANIDKLQDWAKDITFTGPVPGYKNGIAPKLPPWKAAERRIWAIAMSKKKFDTHKQRRWKREAKLGNFLKDINSEALALYNGNVEKVLNAALEGRATS